MNNKAKTFRELIADQFIKSLEEKQLEWKKGWKCNWIPPINAITNKKYKGINKFWLSLISIEKGYTDPRWATFSQVKSKGWKLQKGSKGKKIEYWIPYDLNKKEYITWSEFYKKQQRCEDNSIIFAPKYYIVFNAKDIDGIPKMKLNMAENNIDPDQLISKLSNNMGVQILNDGDDQAFYNPIEDTIHLPLKQNFNDNYSYNSTVLHELSHSTGHANRLNRNIENMFGSNEYVFEELIAEISSCFMGINLQTDYQSEYIENHKSYIQSWIKAIKDKPQTLTKAISEAEKVANYMEFKAEIINKQEYQSTQIQSAFPTDSNKIKIEKDNKFITYKTDKLPLFPKKHKQSNQNKVVFDKQQFKSSKYVTKTEKDKSNGISPTTSFISY